jgi:hypothetical protein
MDMLLRTPAKKIVREHVQKISEEDSVGGAVAGFHAVGLSATGQSNGDDPNSFTIMVTGMQDDFQKVQAELTAELKKRGYGLVSMSYHENPSTHEKTHKCVVKKLVHI